MTKSNQQARLKQARTDQTFDGLQHYVDLHEHSAPLAFVGRDEVLADLMSAVETTATTGCAKAILGGLHNGDHPARIAPLLFGLPTLPTETPTHLPPNENGRDRAESA